MSRRSEVRQMVVQQKRLCVTIVEYGSFLNQRRTEHGVTQKSDCGKRQGVLRYKEGLKVADGGTSSFSASALLAQVENSQLVAVVSAREVEAIKL